MSSIDLRTTRRAQLTMAIVALAFVSAVSSATTSGPSVAARSAENVAIGVCGTCHGPHGNSTNPMFPRLAGQQAGYLIRQLQSFKEQTRGDPDAIAYMWGMAGGLADGTIAALAQFYAAQQAGPGKSHDPAAIARGRDIFQNGIASQGVPACAACHGPDALGSGIYPRLAGQHAQYILKQLASFQSNMRDIAVMHGVAQNLRRPEMAAVADYLESLP